jgi:hypothetical protein
MDITPIKTHRDYRRILNEIAGLIWAKRNSANAVRQCRSARAPTHEEAGA